MIASQLLHTGSPNDMCQMCSNVQSVIAIIIHSSV